MVIDLVYLRGIISYRENSTFNLRVNPATKKSAEEVLSRLGIPMSTAIDMYLRQITLTGEKIFCKNHIDII